MVFFFAGCAALFYLLNVPVRVNVTFRAGTPLTVTLRIGVFDSGSIFEKTFAPTVAAFSVLKENDFYRPGVTAALPAIRYAYRHLSALKFRGRISIGTGDAAQTALLCGLLSAVCAALGKGTIGVVSVLIEPDFNREHLFASVNGMAQMKVGHIMGALSLRFGTDISKKIRRNSYAASN